MEIKNLSREIVQQYGITSASTLTIAEIASMPEKGCYMRIRFKIRDTGQRVDQDFYLSPDRRFISTDLLDVKYDSPQEESYRASILTKAAARKNGSRMATSPILISVFSDFQCPFCKEEDAILHDESLQKYQGKIAIQYFNFPVRGHEWARTAAEIAACAQAQGTYAYREVHQFLFENASNLSDRGLRDQMRGLNTRFGERGINTASLQTCFESGAGGSSVSQDIRLARQVGVVATPTLFINGKKIEGGMISDLKLERILDQMLITIDRNE